MNPFRYLPWLAAGLLLAAPALAQTTPAPADTTRLRYGPAVAAPALLPRPEARDQWKLGLNNFLLNTYPFGVYYSQRPYYARYGLHLAYERRLGRAFSVQAEVSPALTYSRLDPADDLAAGVALRAQLQGRYYYNRERRLRRSRRLSPFAADYLALALGTGLGGSVRETPFYQLTNVPGAVADVALLYGVQRRLGRYGFVDAAAGVSALLGGGGLGPKVGLNGSLRVGLALPAARRAALPVPLDEATTLLPRFFVGAQLGAYSYHVQYATEITLPPITTVTRGSEKQITYYSDSYRYSDFTQFVVALPYVYAGYYLTPRLALQVGVQHDGEVLPYAGSVYFITPDSSFMVSNSIAGRFQEWAVPVQVRYALTPVLKQRFQLELLGGLVPVWTAIRLREYGIVNRQATSQVVREQHRNSFGLHGSLGLAAEYGLGRRRRVQAVAEFVLTKNLAYSLGTTDPVQGGASAGLRYRFGYR